MNSIEIERLLNTNNVKYDTLVPIINEAFIGSNASVINIYIDTYSLFKVLYSSLDIRLGEYNNIASCIINIATHYRHFFRSRYKVESNIYFIHSDNCPYINNQFIRNYNSGAKSNFNAKSDMTNYIENNIDILKLLIPYLPNIYFIESEFESGVAIYDLMCRTDINNEFGHMIITKDIYNFQLVNMKPQTILLRTKRDDSYYVNRNNLMKAYSMERNVKACSKILSPDLFTALVSLNNLKERNINTLFNINKSINVLESAVSEGKILNGYNSDLKYLWDKICEDLPEVGYTTFEFRFKAIDILFQHSVYINSVECANMDMSLVDKVDPETVKEINNKFFIKNPLDLNRV